MRVTFYLRSLLLVNLPLNIFLYTYNSEIIKFSLFLSPSLYHFQYLLQI